MFDFVISQQQKKLPTRRFVAASIVSWLAHAALLVVLVEYPELLRPGMKLWYDIPSFTDESPDRDWRMVATLHAPPRMQLPSEATLRRNLYDWSKAQGSGGVMPPIRVRWGDEEPASRGNTQEAAARIRPTPGTEDPSPVPDVPPAGPEPPSAVTEAADTSSARPAPGGQQAGTEALAAGRTRAPLPERQPDQEPRAIPEGIEEAGARPPAPPAPPRPAQEQTRVFRDEQTAIRSEGSGLFDTKGFPLGEYADVIIARIRGNWLIPSNLRNSQGRTTIVFFIDRDGRFANARIVNSSGSSSLDLTALNAVIVSNPFPPLPDGFPGDRVGAKFVFSYNERQ